MTNIKEIPLEDFFRKIKGKSTYKIMDSPSDEEELRDSVVLHEEPLSRSGFNYLCGNYEYLIVSSDWRSSLSCFDNTEYLEAEISWREVSDSRTYEFILNDGLILTGEVVGIIQTDDGYKMLGIRFPNDSYFFMDFSERHNLDPIREVGFSSFSSSTQRFRKSSQREKFKIKTMKTRFD